MKEKESKSRRFCYTINNYTEEELKDFIKLAESLENHRYICFGLEIAPTTGTKHIQGYIELNESQRYSFLHKYFNFKRDKKILKFHIENANGTAEENKVYTGKDNEFYEFGEPIKQGARTDLIEIKMLVKDNPKNLNKIIDERANNLQQLKFAQSIQPIYLSDRNPKFPPHVFWIFGSTGVGKTSLVYRNFDDVCSVSSPRWAGTGYNQNECLLFDDIREFDIAFNDLLKITDRFPYTLERKHGQIALNSPFIVFTAPKCIDQTFTSTRENLMQLKRRLIEIDLDSVENINDIDLKNLDEKYKFKGVNYPQSNF